MKTWMLPWLLPVGLLTTVVFFTVVGTYAGPILIVVGLIVLPPVLWRLRFPSSGDDADVKYWRFGPR